MLAYHINQHHIRQADQNMFDRIPGKLQKRKEQKRYNNRNKNSTEQFFSHDIEKISSLLLGEDSFYKQKQCDTCPVIEQGFAFYHRRHIFGHAEFIQDTCGSNRVRRGNDTSQQNTGPQIHIHMKNKRNRKKYKSVNR